MSEEPVGGAGDRNGGARQAELDARASSGLVVGDHAKQINVFTGPSPDERRAPWASPPLDFTVERPDLSDPLLTAVTGPSAGITVLHGPGGFGKTRLATWLCHHPKLANAFPGGLMWLTLGQHVVGATLAERINNLSFLLSGERPQVSDPLVAGTEFGRLVDEKGKGRVLVILDDAWAESQLSPFRSSARGAVLVTTRLVDFGPDSAARFLVGTMTPAQAVRVVAAGVADLTTSESRSLAELAGKWPLLLSLTNRQLRTRLRRGQAATGAVRDVVDRLSRFGPSTFDHRHQDDRALAVSATVAASIGLLPAADQERVADLAIFPEDTDIPLRILDLLWPGQADRVCDELHNVGIAADYRLDPPYPRLTMHDVVSDFLRSSQDQVGLARRHLRLLLAVEPLRHEDSLDPLSWLTLPEDDYLWRHLPHHLRGAGRRKTLDRVVRDLRWLETKTRVFGSPVSVEADLAMLASPDAEVLRESISRSAKVFLPTDPPSALGATIASRLGEAGALRASAEAYRSRLAMPLLVPARPMPDGADPNLARVFAGHSASVVTCEFAGAGQSRLVSAGHDATVRLWDPGLGRSRVLTGHEASVYDCAFSPDGEVVASVGDAACLWDVRSGVLTGRLNGHEDGVYGCAFSPDGRLLATSSADHTVRLWRLADRQCVRVLRGHTAGVNRCAFSPDGRMLVSAGDDGTMRFWRVEAEAADRSASRDGGDDGPTMTVRGGRGWVNACCVSADGLAAAGVDAEGVVHIVGMPGGDRLRTLRAGPGRVFDLAFSPDGMTLATAGDDLKLWDLRTGDVVAVLSAGSGGVCDCSFSPDGRLIAAACTDNTVRVWELGAALAGFRTRDHHEPATRCAFSPSGRLVAAGGVDGTLLLRDTTTWAEVRRIAVAEASATPIRDCAFSADGASLAVVDDSTQIRVWDVSSGVEISTFGRSDTTFLSCAFSPDGEHLVAVGGAQPALFVWARHRAPAPLRYLVDGAVWLRGCVFSPDGSQLVTVGDAIRVWDAATWRVIATLRRPDGAGGWTNDAAFSRDGALLATGDDDGALCLWNIGDGRLLAHRLCPAPVLACSVSPDGGAVAAVSDLLRVWRLPADGWECGIRVAEPLYDVRWSPDGRLIGSAGPAGLYMFNYLTA